MLSRKNLNALNLTKLQARRISVNARLRKLEPHNRMYSMHTNELKEINNALERRTGYMKGSSRTRRHKKRSNRTRRHQ